MPHDSFMFHSVSPTRLSSLQVKMPGSDSLTSSTTCSKGVDAVPIKGAISPGRHTAVPGFSRFEYMDAGPVGSIALRPCSKGTTSSSVSASSSRSPSRLLKTQMPFSPRGAGTFSAFVYAIDPYETPELIRDIHLKRESARIRAGPFKAGGNARSEKSPTKGASGLRAQLFMELRAEWPSFLRVTEDDSGYLLAVFSTGGGMHDRRHELHAYMNRFASSRPLVLASKLARDASRWGVLAGDEDPVIVYSLRPPWVASNPVGVFQAAKLNQQREQ
uniref:Uncharacterized protein n=1 Tax=Chrysotila carterae TaxID=13221 RepID=A0A7S4C2J8_CHRCT